MLLLGRSPYVHYYDLIVCVCVIQYPVQGGNAANSRSPADRDNFTLLLNAIRAAIGPDKLLTIASTNIPGYIDNLDLPGLNAVLDWV